MSEQGSVHVHAVACFVKCSLTPLMCLKKASACTNWCCTLHCLSHNLLLCCVQPKMLINNDKDEKLEEQSERESWKQKEHDRMQTQIQHQIQWNTNTRPQPETGRFAYYGRVISRLEFCPGKPTTPPSMELTVPLCLRRDRCC